MIECKLTNTRPIGISGAGSDRRFAMARLAANYEKDPVDVLIGDWLSEGNMTTSAGRFAGKTSISRSSTLHILT